MTTPLILDSLEIQQFRAFRHLRIEHLGRVNLIVGKNNVGKSCLLEALWLYAHLGDPVLIWKLLQGRDEDSQIISRRTALRTQNWTQAIKHLFYGRREIIENQEMTIQIGPANSRKNMLSIVLTWFKEQVEKQADLQVPPSEEDSTIKNPIPGLIVKMGAQPQFSHRFNRDVTEEWLPSKPRGIPCIFVSANGLNKGEILQFWDSIALTDLEEDVLTSLRIIAPEVERINLIGNQKHLNGQRVPIVKVARLDSPVPLRSLGEGMSRLFGITLALVNTKDGLLLLDEIESGLHYSVQLDLWRLIFKVAHRLNVQVFATTHSWDCIKAFQMAAQEDEAEEGVLISLRRKQGHEDEIVAVLFNEEELNVVAPAQIEVR